MFKRIRRVAKGETVLVGILAEDLQDMYHKLEELRDDSIRALEECRECETDMVLREKAVRLVCNAKILRERFWLCVQERYKLWSESIGIRDNYAIVRLSEPGDSLEDFKRFLGRMLSGEGDSTNQD